MSPTSRKPDSASDEAAKLRRGHQALEAERDALERDLADLRREFATTAANRAEVARLAQAHGKTIEQLRSQLEAQYADLDALKNERNLLQAQLAEMQRHFESAEADRAARGTVIEEQGNQIGRLQGQCELLQGQLRDLQGRFDADYKAQASTIATLHGEIDACLEELSTLYGTEPGAHHPGELSGRIRGRLEEIRGLRESVENLEAQLADARGRLVECEADRSARGEVIEQGGRRTSELEALVHETEKNRDWHKAEGERLAGEVAGLQRRIAEREDHIRRAEARWWHRLGRRLGLM